MKPQKKNAQEMRLSEMVEVNAVKYSATPATESFSVAPSKEETPDLRVVDAVEVNDSSDSSRFIKFKKLVRRHKCFALAAVLICVGVGSALSLLLNASKGNRLSAFPPFRLSFLACFFSFILSFVP